MKTAAICTGLHQGYFDRGIVPIRGTSRWILISRRNCALRVCVSFNGRSCSFFRQAHFYPVHLRCERLIFLFLALQRRNFCSPYARTVAFGSYFSEEHFSRVSTLGIYAGVFLSAWESPDLPPQRYPKCLRRGLSTLVARETFNTRRTIASV